MTKCCSLWLPASRRGDGRTLHGFPRSPQDRLQAIFDALPGMWRSMADPTGAGFPIARPSQLPFQWRTLSGREAEPTTLGVGGGARKIGDRLIPQISGSDSRQNHIHACLYATAWWNAAVPHCERRRAQEPLYPCHSQ